MDPDYPSQLLSREAAPRYRGEGGFAPWHFSEEPDLASSARPRLGWTPRPARRL